MRTQLIEYAEKNETEIRKIIDPLLNKRGMTFQEYIQMMKCQTTCGFEITFMTFEHTVLFKRLVGPFLFDPRSVGISG